MKVCEKCGHTYEGRRGRRYCSKRCSNIANARSRGGLYFAKGRLVVWCRDNTAMYYARAVMAAELGRLLESHEHVHHVNGNPMDDRVENLRIMSCSEHMRLHRTAA